MKRHLVSQVPRIDLVVLGLPHNVIKPEKIVLKYFFNVKIFFVKLKFQTIFFQALLHYEEGLRLLDQALALDLPNDVSNVIPDDCDKEIIKVHKTRINLSRTRQQVAFRIHELKSKLQSETASPTTIPSAPPPSYEESVQNSLESALNKDLNR